MAKTILCDTRQQANKHSVKDEYFESIGVEQVRTKLPWGDYCLPPKVSCDTKASIYELAQNIDHEHARFRNEQIKARDSGSLLVILVENEEGVTDLDSLSQWNESKQHFRMRKARSGNMYASQIEGSRLAKACATMNRKYGTVFDFCSPEESGERVLKWLGECHGRE